jgi:hypothetical protein
LKKKTEAGNEKRLTFIFAGRLSDGVMRAFSFFLSNEHKICDIKGAVN